MEQYIPWTATTQCPTVQTHTPHRMQEDPHSMSRWHRTVHIPWLVDSYDTHKGKRWLNSNPQATGTHVWWVHCHQNWVIFWKLDHFPILDRMVASVRLWEGVSENRQIFRKITQFRWHCTHHMLVLHKTSFIFPLYCPVFCLSYTRSNSHLAQLDIV